MILDSNKIIHEYKNKYGYLFENDTLILLEQIELKKKIEEIKKKYDKKIEDLRIKKDEILEKLKDFSIDVASELEDDFTEKIEKRMQKVKQVYLIKKGILDKNKFNEIKRLKVSGKGKLVSAAALASFLIYTGYKVYEKRKDDLKRDCINKTGRDRYLCLKKIKIDCLKNRLDFLKRSVFKCRYSENPVKCRSKIDQEILKVQEKVKDKALDIVSTMTRGKVI